MLPEEVYRACHTLVGSSTMAEARHGMRLAEPLNHWLRKSFDSGVGLDDSDLLLLGDCMTAMEAVAGHLDEATGFFVRARHAARAHRARRAGAGPAHRRGERSCARAAASACSCPIRPAEL